MGDKVKAREKVKDKLSARVWNRMVDAARDFEKRRLGRGEKPVAGIYDPCCVMIRNDSGSDRLAGESLEVGSFILTSRNKENRWFSGDLRSGNNACGILEYALPYGEIGPLRMAGLAEAQVDVIDVDHTHCYTATGDENPQSNFGGPIEILSKPSGTGLKTCLVRLASPIYIRQCILDQDIAAGDHGDVSVWIGGVDVGSVDAWFDWMEGGTASLSSGADGWICWLDDRQRWQILTAECPG